MHSQQTIASQILYALENQNTHMAMLLQYSLYWGGLALNLQPLLGVPIIKIK